MSAETKRGPGNYARSCRGGLLAALRNHEQGEGGDGPTDGDPVRPVRNLAWRDDECTRRIGQAHAGIRA